MGVSAAANVIAMVVAARQAPERLPQDCTGEELMRRVRPHLPRDLRLHHCWASPAFTAQQQQDAGPARAPTAAEDDGSGDGSGDGSDDAAGEEEEDEDEEAGRGQAQRRARVFSARKCCTSRVYAYLLPLWALDPLVSAAQRMGHASLGPQVA